MRIFSPKKIPAPRKFRMIRPFIFVVILAAAAGAVYARGELKAAEARQREVAAVKIDRHPYLTRSLTVGSGATYGALMTEAGVPAAIATGIFDAARDVYDLSRLRAARTVRLTYDRDTGALRRFAYRIDSEEDLEVARVEHGEDDPVWVASRRPIPYEVSTRVVEGEITTSLYAAALAQGIDERAIIALADVFQWTVDFVLDVRQGDRFKMVYEERFLDGKYVMPGKVLAAKYVGADGPRYAFYFEDSSGQAGHFDENGGSVQRIFLKTPAEFRYISSGFTTGQRYVSAFNVSTGHRAVDYAAPIGTPIRTVGDGTVSFAGWGGAYGNKVSVRHNSVYSTNYGHMSRILVRQGQRVSQGQTIGLVGSTGFSTGPHLHYEMVKNGTKINPLREEFPSTAPVAEADRVKFLDLVRSYREQLDK